MQAPSQVHIPLGNDVVDLCTAHNRRSASNPRYLERVLAPVEQQSLADAAVRDLVFWAYWAAKEAAYKALKKSSEDLILSHRQFVVTPSTPLTIDGKHPGTTSGTVKHADQLLEVKWIWGIDWVHCLTVNCSGTLSYKVADIGDLTDTESFINLKSTTRLSDESVAARILALSLLEAHGIGDVQIHRPVVSRRQGPPEIYRDGKQLTNLDISLSHDGRFAAAAVFLE